MKSQRLIKNWCRAILVLSLVLTLAALPAQAKDEEFRYRYVSLAAIELPPGIIAFLPLAITNSGRIYGAALDENFLSRNAVYAQGVLTVFQYPQYPQSTNFFFYVVNQEGTIGGSVVFDPVNFIQQAALFRGDQVELIPPLPGEMASYVIALNDAGMALVVSVDVNYQGTYFLYHNGEVIPLDFGPNINPDLLQINNQGIISGTTLNFNTGIYRGFRFNYRTGEATLLDPLPTEPNSWALNINNRGDVLGYSFIGGGIERIGVWDREGQFKTYFVEEGPPYRPSTLLQFNDNNLIVLSGVDGYNSYLFPRPGVRLNLADLVENLPSGGTLPFIDAINNQGNMLGSSYTDFFLLERIGLGAPTQAPAPDYGGERHREVMEKAKKARELRKLWQPWLNGGRQK